jgi:hypothetical protein
VWMRRRVGFVWTAALAPLVALTSCSSFGSDGAPAADDGGADAAFADAGDASASAVTVTGLKGAVTGIAVTETEVVFMVSPGGIFACPLEGCAGAPRAITTLESPRHLVYYRDLVYWFDADLGEVRGVPVAGGIPFRVLQDAVIGIAPSPTGLWLGHGSFLTRCPLTGGGACGPSPSVTIPTALAGDGAFVYWLNVSGTVGYLDVVAQAVGPLLATNVSQPVAVYAASDSFYLLHLGGSVVRYGRLVSSPDAGAPAPIATGITSPAKLTVIADTVYVTAGGATGGQVLSAPAGGGAPRVVAQGLASPDAIAAHGDALYVGVTGGIVRIPR